MDSEDKSFISTLLVNVSSSFSRVNDSLKLVKLGLYLFSLLLLSEIVINIITISKEIIL